MDIDAESGQVISSRKAVPPPHGLGVIPQWLSTFAVDVVIAGGMGVRAIQLFESAGIRLVRCAATGAPEDLVRDYLAGQLVLGPDTCDHGEGHVCHHEEEDRDLQG